MLFLFKQRPQLVKGSMQLFSVDQQRSQALEAHAASFASFRVGMLVLPVQLAFFFTECVAYRFLCLLSRCQEMTKILFLFLLRQRHPMLDRLSQSCMLLSLEPNQVLICCVAFTFLSFFRISL